MATSSGWMRRDSGATRGLAALLAALLAAPAWATAPQRVLYQGTLRRNGMIYTGSATFVFRITNAVGSVSYWNSGSTTVVVTSGLFRYPLGITATGGDGGFPAIDWTNIDPYIEVTVDGTILTPRESMVSVPYALAGDPTKVLKAGDTMTGQLTLSGSTLTATGMDASGYSLKLSSGINTPAGTVVAGLFVGNGSGLTNVTSIAIDSTKVLKAGDTMTGALTMSGASANVISGSSVTASAFFGDGLGLSNLNATQLLSGTVPTGRLSGAYTSITGVGTLTAGTWNATLMGSTYGGTGANLSAAAAGGVPYFSALGVMGASAAGSSGSVLQSNGTSAPTWVAPASSSLLASTNTWSAQQFFLNQLTISTSAIISGNVGIGTTSPGQKLDVQGGHINAQYGLIAATATLNPIASAPVGSAGMLYYDSGTSKLRLYNGAWVDVTTGTTGGELSSVTSDAAQFSGLGTSGSALTLLSSSVTLQGNAFNAADKLVRLSALGYYPALNGSLITNLNAGNLASGTVPLAQLAGITNAQIAAGTFGNITIPAANVAIGSLGASVIASSVAVGAINANDQLAVAGGIADSKLAVIATAGKVADSALPSSLGAKTFTGLITANAGITLAANQALNLSGASGNINTVSSVTASAFFGRGEGLTGVSATYSP